jgi:hypothetical protein
VETVALVRLPLAPAKRIALPTSDRIAGSARYPSDRAARAPPPSAL